MPDAVTLGLLGAAIVIVVVVVTLLFQRAPVKRRPVEGPAAALLALARGDRARALRLLRSAVEAPDVDVETMLVLGHLLREHGEIDQALHLHHAVLGRTGLSPEQRRLVELQLVDDLLAGGHDERAETRLAALDEHYEDAEILDRRARALLRLRRFDDAVDVLVRRAAVDRDDTAGRARAADGLAEIAREHLRAGNVQTAARVANTAIDTDPARAAGYVVLGDTEMHAGQMDTAVGHWIEGLRRAPGGGELLLGRVLEASLQKGRLESLVDTMEALRAERPDDAWLWRATADLRLRRGDREEFFALLEEAPDGAASQIEGWAGWIRHLHARGDESELRRLLSMLPDAFGPRAWRCPECGTEDDEPRVACGRCGFIGALRPVTPDTRLPHRTEAPASIPGGRLQ